ncbi:putative baseplate assembly protein [Aetokthonos hydrillicola Thurmond2011]|jgi:photosystem II stability/assembly factor-like uncharacterized protein|uniref:Baseplate assembly protein n=1 Tax=Aetokthonos hydrillicola Thurmond2011 TaxID=2712845 RepID=A0AAP5I4R9_9CYAN|nr:putative baseplate assembly protein [Aetokthonos hydrillicola]MBO3457582.1 putative baseplate assembly protein [Aetokthonos hydrillicola CCALA 1050]MBW4590915.1 putative baseplate assembly protein [Aetokthonos hydrillicola CCALA 1050]MDR9894736.1 putative baseplate assembly protein [Aetokthonos hydrillicola Thurmond2011]
MNSNHQPLSLNNRPGLPAINYRIGDWASFRRRMLANLPKAQGNPEDAKDRPLAKLNTRADDDPAIAILDAWAVVADVLTFYQERIANEGFLKTATEELSVVELVRSIGYELDPGVAASTWLAFTVEDTPSSPGVATVVKGTPVDSLPGEGELPQTFETSAEMIARVEWNALKPRLTRQQDISVNTEIIYLQGINTQLQAGDRLLLIDEERPHECWYLLTLATVIVIPEAGYTAVTWNQGLLSTIDKPLRKPLVFAFRQKAALFGANAPKWGDMPNEIKRAFAGTIKGGVFCTANNGASWTPSNDGLANLDIRCLAFNQKSGSIFAGTAGNGIFRSQDNGQNWQPVNINLTNLNIQQLYINTDGYIFAGTPNGGVFSSKDDGENWSNLSVGTIGIKSTGTNSWESSNTGLPNTVVRSLATYNNYIFIGTDKGVYRSQDQGKNWDLNKLENQVVRSLLVYTKLAPAKGTISSKDTTVTGNSDTDFQQQFAVGNFITAANQTKKITSIKSKNELTVDKAFSPDLSAGTAFFMDRNFIFAGTDNGVYRSDDLGETWNPKNLTTKSVYSIITYTIPRRVGIGTISSNEITVNFDVPFSTANLHPGDIITVGNEARTVVKINSDTQFVIDAQFSSNFAPNTAFSLGGTYIFVATNGGVYRSPNLGDNWDQVFTTKPIVRSLTTYEHDGLRYIFAGTKGGVFVSTDHGNSWQDVTTNPQNVDVTSLAVGVKTGTGSVSGTANNVFAGNVFAGFVEDADGEWKNFQIQPAANNAKQLLDLDTLYPRILAQSWMVLLKEDGTQAQPLIVESVATVSRRDYGLESKVTQVSVNTKVNPSDFPLRRTTVLAVSEQLNLAEEQLTVKIQQQQIFNDPISNNKIYLKEFVPGLRPDKVLLFSGKRIRVQINNVGGVFSFTKDGKWLRKNQSLTNTVVQILVSDVEGNLFAGTESGALKFAVNGEKWEPFDDLKNKNIPDLIITNGTMFAATASTGIFRSQNHGETWEETNTGLANQNIIALTADDDNIFAATSGSIFISQNNGSNWNAIATFLINVEITSLLYTGGFLFAGTNQGVYRSSDEGSSWQQVLQQTNISALGTNHSGDILAGTANSGVFRTKKNGDTWDEWLPINTNLNDVHIRCLAIKQGTDDAYVGTDMSGVFRYIDDSTGWQQLNNGLKSIDVRAIAIHDDNIYAGGVGILAAFDGMSSAELKIGDSLQLFSPSQSATWKLIDKNGFVGSLEILEPEDMTLLPANKEDATVSEIAVINTPPDNQKLPILILQQSLQNSYDPATTTIYANVVAANHGETIEEVLGSGDGTLANQTFILQKPPLTYISATTPSGNQSTLQVFVDGVLWLEAASLYELTPTEQKYITRIDDDGTTAVIFGDGKKGARLPSGVENVLAIYRSGIGLGGNLPQDRLSLLKKRPLALKEVTNPLPATGGASREPMEEARTSAPLTVRTLDRIVSLQDFEDFTRAFGGIGKAQARLLQNRATRIIHITVAAMGGDEVRTDSSLYQNLVKAIDAARDPMGVVVEVDSYQALLFNVAAKIVIDSKRQPITVLENVRTALLARFAFAKRDFGQSVTASEVIATMQNIPGVIAVAVDALYRQNLSKTLEDILLANKADWNEAKDQILPAQLLLLHTEGIKLSYEIM